MFYLRHPKITGPFFSALGYYLPMSLLWLFLGRALVSFQGYPVKTFGVETERFGKVLVIVGLAICAAGFAMNHVQVTVVGMMFAMAGMDGVAWARESKERKL
jgi:hypothetical protein